MASDYIELHKAPYQGTGINQAGESPESLADVNGRKRNFTDYLESSEDLEIPISKFRRITISPPDAELEESLSADQLFEELTRSSGCNLLGEPLSADETASGVNHGLQLSPNKSSNALKNPPGPLDALRYPLYKHQLLGLKWMKQMEKNMKINGGILADDMGLGKTLTTIALMLSRDAEPQTWANVKTNVIVAPVALLNQWQREIKQKILPDRQLKVFLYHSSKKEYKQLCKYDVVLTSYGMLVSEYNRREKYINEATKAGFPADNGYLSQICPFISPNSCFYRVILDEAQCIKNPRTKASLAVCQIKAKYRWCLSGTPMQNGPNELAPLIRFLKIQPYCKVEEFKKAFGSLQPKGKFSGTTDTRSKAMKSLQKFLNSILLRRTKKSKIDGKPIIQLKEKIEVVDHVVFDSDQKEFYNTLEKDARVQFSKYLRAGTIGRHYTKVLVLLLRLRQACCHPYLHLTDLELVPPDIQEEEAEKFASRLSPEAVERIKGTGPFQCSVCFDVIMAQPSIMCPCADLLCPPCAEAFSNLIAQNRIRAGQDQSLNGQIECPACHNKGEFAIIKFSSFSKVHQPKPVMAVKKSETGGDTDDTDDTDSSYDSDNSDDSHWECSAKFVPEELAKLCQKARHNMRAREKYFRTLRSIWQPSAKVTKCCEIIGDIQNTTKEKVIVFSQWTVFLDLLQIAIEDALHIRVGRYDGSMTAIKRDEAVNEFTENPEVKVMLVSLKAGNAGLNLTVASQVILMDPFWNPYVENQAVDRTYRIGQQRDVTVHRILVEGTVEDRIMATQEQKRKIVEFALQGDGTSNGDSSKLGTEDLAFLFGVGSKK
ncbi:SNF2 family N-terminal domain-containing protein [Daldinia caldariorum]|uniref:SNF2 family N-terminal domain-containing protein n=1 Tax=Daldinia caldariorum TaxID=326644 RepID=UPI002008DEF7|nr:SNF2 family N-terminal domain-containing protein [Daldinia caldariorum]KAI1463656.1 SNF2 family N-terminal domain-containing protein [Daldinia caldariorum]